MSNRWEFKSLNDECGSNVLTLEPKMKEMQEWLYEASRELNRKIMTAEEELLIKSLPALSLEELKQIIIREQKKRKARKLNL